MCPWRFAGELFEIVGAAIGGDWATARELINHSRRRGSGYGQDFGITYSSAAVESDGGTPQVPTDPQNDYIPEAIPGHRAPHVWLERDGERISSPDLFGRSEHLGVGCWGFIEHSSSGFLPAR